MIMAMVRAEPIFHIITVMINTMPRTAGIMIIRDIGLNTTEVIIDPITTKTGVGMTMTATIGTIILTAETVISGLPINKRQPFIPAGNASSKLSMAIRGISLYNATLSGQHSD